MAYHLGYDLMATLLRASRLEVTASLLWPTSRKDRGWCKLQETKNWIQSRWTGDYFLTGVIEEIDELKINTDPSETKCRVRNLSLFLGSMGVLSSARNALDVMYLERLEI